MPLGSFNHRPLSLPHPYALSPFREIDTFPGTSIQLRPTKETPDKESLRACVMLRFENGGRGEGDAPFVFRNGASCSALSYARGTRAKRRKASCALARSGQMTDAVAFGRRKEANAAMQARACAHLFQGTREQRVSHLLAFGIPVLSAESSACPLRARV